MQRLVECVPNFSEGRNRGTIQALVAAVKAIKGVYVLDEEMDYDHHRAVLTIAGDPEAVAEAAFQAARVARDRIDLRTHQGGHPRVGATDVVPFIPIRGITMGECVALARKVGQRIGKELDIPVFLYEAAASHPDRKNLEVIRKGNLEGLASRMEADSHWAPDFGPQRLHPSAGATVVGARPPLIAFNVNLQTPDVTIAKAIAKKIRFSSGGLPCVKAIGVELSSRKVAQVSMNLTNFEETPIHVAFEAVRREAEERGVHVSDSEVVGLVPQQALIRAAEFGLKLQNFDPTQVLETRLDQVLAGTGGPDDSGSDLSASLRGFLEEVSAGTPTPGGGSVAALAGSLAAALGVMGCRVGAPAEKKTPPSEPANASQAALVLEPVERQLLALRDRLQALVQADADAYAGVVKAYRLPRNEPSRAEAIAASIQVATEVPLETATLSCEVAGLLRQLFSQTKPAVESDLRVGLLLALAAIEGGLENVITNLKQLKNQELINKITGKIQGIKRSLVELKKL